MIVRGRVAAPFWAADRPRPGRGAGAADRPRPGRGAAAAPNADRPRPGRGDVRASPRDAGADYGKKRGRQSPRPFLLDTGKRSRRATTRDDIYATQDEVAKLLDPLKKGRKKKDQDEDHPEDGSLPLPKHLRVPEPYDFQLRDGRARLSQLRAAEKERWLALQDTPEKRAALEADPAALRSLSLLSAEDATEKARLVAEGFHDWNKAQFTVFLKASARHGREQYDRIAADIGQVGL